MKRPRLNTKERLLLLNIGDELLEVQNDWQRRLRNALLCLSLSDPRWMIWVEREIDVESMSLQEITRLIEVRARTVVLKAYNYFGRQCIGNCIFRDDWVFTDRGNLGPG